jgi:Rrf2 family transcriptional regulator, iron-sulfur cluster assembly transcription factor
MKINAIDEYGLRVLLQIAKAKTTDGLNISQLSELEGLSTAYVAKITRTLKAGGLINSTRGYKGGYVLAMDPSEITIQQVLQALGGNLYDPSFCASHAGEMRFCSNSVDCSVRSLWRMVQASVDQLLSKITLEDLMGSEIKSTQKLQFLYEKTIVEV